MRVSYRFPWYRLADEHLLDLRICDLALKISSTLEPLLGADNEKSCAPPGCNFLQARAFG